MEKMGGNQSEKKGSANQPQFQVNDEHNENMGGRATGQSRETDRRSRASFSSKNQCFAHFWDGALQSCLSQDKYTMPFSPHPPPMVVSRTPLQRGICFAQLMGGESRTKTGFGT